MTNKLLTEGSVRADLLGGTLDLPPIHLILPDVVTINVALSLKAKVEIEESGEDGVRFVSEDYDSDIFFSRSDFIPEKLKGDHFGPLSFIAQICHFLGLSSGVTIRTKSGSPAGAGLGGSSSMGVTLFKAISKFQGKSFDPRRGIEIVRNIESIILNKGPAGYQDYYPALYGGILALKANAEQIEIEQFYDVGLVDSLKKRVVLIYSGQPRLSGINNWEVYKGFFDGVSILQKGLEKINELSRDALQALRGKDVDALLNLMILEGSTRSEMFDDLVTDDMKLLLSKVQEEDETAGLKVCGAGGGGCFLIIHRAGFGDRVEQLANEMNLTPLEFDIEAPLE